METVTLSLAAVDMLWEQLDLGELPYPLEVPRFGDTPEERDRIRTAVREDLTRRGLLRDGEPDATLVEGLRCLADGQLIITLAGLLNTEKQQLLAARVSARGRQTVLGVLQDNTMRMDFLEPSGMVFGIVELLPQLPGGPGEPVELSLPATKRRGGGVGPGAAREESPELLAAEELLSRPKIRLGQFSVLAKDDRGLRYRLPELAWFDTADGRYGVTTRRGADSSDVVTYAPMDSTGLARRIFEMIQELVAKQSR
ncbi:ESX secretion-associated protein EspG [Pseudonocardiaceae bacterium YIM PH 21723]|nr:ESX secretion-associated protein EspG [Pseudonocardiaceae bacterium YIM PH 21723]